METSSTIAICAGPDVSIIQHVMKFCPPTLHRNPSLRPPRSKHPKQTSSKHPNHDNTCQPKRRGGAAGAAVAVVLASDAAAALLRGPPSSAPAERRGLWTPAALRAGQATGDEGRCGPMRSGELARVTARARAEGESLGSVGIGMGLEPAAFKASPFEL